MITDSCISPTAWFRASSAVFATQYPGARAGWGCRRGRMAQNTARSSSALNGEDEMVMLWKGFQKPKRLATDTETLTEKYGRFWAQPFERGFGTTIGNALRRVLLSSIEGAAVTAVKIEGVVQGCQSIRGVVEDATDIILNLKQFPFKLNGDGLKALDRRAN